MNRRGFMGVLLAGIAAPALGVMAWLRRDRTLDIAKDCGRLTDEELWAQYRNHPPIYIHGTLGDDANDGLSWATARKTPPMILKPGTTIYITNARLT